MIPFEELQKQSPSDRLKYIYDVLAELTAKKEKSKQFVKPTIEEVEYYGQIIGFKVNGEEFVSHYEASGWKRGNTLIKDWKACIRTWKIKAQERQAQAPVITHRIVKLVCSSCSAEVNTKIPVNQDVTSFSCKTCGRQSLQELL